MRKEKVKFTFGEPRRSVHRSGARPYEVIIADDEEAHAEAMRFFGDDLIIHYDVPDFIHDLPLQDAQAHLDANPITLKCSMLTLNPLSNYSDEDLFRLHHLPELERFHSHIDRLTDAGVAHLNDHPGIIHLLIYSPNVTDDCLWDISTLRMLLTLDMQLSPNVSKTAFDRLLMDLPHLIDIYSPHNEST